MSATVDDEQHFIKPLVPGFEDQLLIPAAFMKYLKGQMGEIVTLRSRREGKLWPVKINGRQFGDGWNQFVQDHDLQLGDILLFRYEADLNFYVLVLGHDTFEREYTPFTATEEESLEVQEQNLRNSCSDYSPFDTTEEVPIEIQEQSLPNCSVTGSDLERNMKGKTVLEAKVSSFPNCVVKVTPDSIKKCRLHIPWKFVAECGLNPQTYLVLLEDENSDYWSAVLSYNSLAKRFCIGGGWASYRSVHKLKAGDSLMIELVKTGETLVFKMTTLKKL